MFKKDISNVRIDSEIMNEIDKLSVKELIELKEIIDEMITEKLKNKKEYVFEFNAENDPRKGKPYVARLFLKGGKLKRVFHDLNREYEGKILRVWGKFTAREGEIIEQREGGSWKNDYRYWYLVRNGELIKVADIDNSDEKSRVLEYLGGKITAEELLEKTKE